MKLTPYKIESSVGNYESRYILDAILLDVEQKVLVATDGHQLAVVPAEPEKYDTTGIIPSKAFRMAREAQRRVPKKMRRKNPVTLSVNGRVTIRSKYNDEAISVSRGKGQFPKWREAIEKFEGAPDAIIDIELLKKAIGSITDNTSHTSGMFAIWINKESSPTQKSILLSPAYGTKDRFAILMPARQTEPIDAAEILKAVRP